MNKLTRFVTSLDNQLVIRLIEDSTCVVGLDQTAARCTFIHASSHTIMKEIAII